MRSDAMEILNVRTMSREEQTEKFSKDNEEALSLADIRIYDLKLYFELAKTKNKDMTATKFINLWWDGEKPWLTKQQ